MTCLDYIYKYADGAVLDLGCGNNPYISNALADKGCSVIAVDLYDNIEGLNDKVRYVKATDASKIPLNDSSVNCIIASNVLEHSCNLGNSLLEIRRVLTDGGRLIVVVPKYKNIVVNHFTTGWNVGQLAYVLAGFGFDCSLSSFVNIESSVVGSGIKSELLVSPTHFGSNGVSIHSVLPYLPSAVINTIRSKRSDFFNSSSTDTALNNVDVVRDIIKARRSTRWFNNRPVSREDILDIVEAGVYAPSSSNSQNQRFLIIDDREELEHLGSYRYAFPYPTGFHNHPTGIIGECSACVVVFVDSSIVKYPKDEYKMWSGLWIQNASASIENMLLLATAKGIGSCWVSATPDMNGTRTLRGKTWKEVLQRYNIPDSWIVYGIVMLGYPKRINSKGLPMGETMHQGHSTNRKEVNFYLAEVNR